MNSPELNQPSEEATTAPPGAAVASSAYVAAVARKVVLRSWWPLMVVVPLTVWGVACDLRFALLGLILLLIVYPMVAVFAIMTHCATPEFALRAASSRFSVDNGLLVGYAATVADDGSMDEHVTFRSAIRSVARRNGASVVSVGTGIADFLIVPDTATDAESLAALLTIHNREYTSSL